MRAVEIKKGIYWVGGIDWDLRNFHGYITQRGSTYNSYLIIDDKITLIDNVKSYLAEEQLKRISQIIEPTKIDYIVQNHIEMDHSGSLPIIMQKNPKAKVYASPKGVEGLPKHYAEEWDFQPVKSGDKLNLGKRTLKFVQTPMVHWPDNMISYCPEEKILFSNDSFGQHIASSQRIDENYPFNILMEEAKKYYANIVLPYGRQVQKALATASDLEIEYICPSHGLIWHKYISQIMAEYEKWANNETEKKSLVIYDSMWGSTQKIAAAIHSVFEDLGYNTALLNLRTNHISDIMTEVLTAEYICVGSPTLNNNILPTVAAFLTYLKGLAPKNRQALAFGSYGWGGQSIGIVEKTLQECGFDTLPQIKAQYVPNEAKLEEIKDKLKDHLK